jgi:hypothetical protein
MLVTLAGIVNETKLLAPEKAFAPMLVILAGSVTEVRLAHPEKTLSPKRLTPSPTVTAVKVLLFANAEAPIEETLSGITNSVRRLPLKAPSPIVSTLFGIVIEVIPEFLNANLLISVILPGSITCVTPNAPSNIDSHTVVIPSPSITVKFRQFLKRLPPALSTLPGIVNELKLAQPSNALFPICVTLFEIMREVSLEQFKKAPLPMCVTLSGIINSVRPIQPVNALFPIWVTLFGIVSEPKDSQPKNALFPILITPFGIAYPPLLLLGYLISDDIEASNRTPSKDEKAGFPSATVNDSTVIVFTLSMFVTPAGIVIDTNGSSLLEWLKTA